MKSTMKRLILAMSLALVASGAFAAEGGRKVNFQTVLTDLEGKPIPADCKTPSEDKKTCLEWTEMTLAMVSMAALTRQYPNDDVKLEDQLRRTMLAQEVIKSTEVVLDSHDTDLLITLISKLVNKSNMSTIITFRAVELLDPVRLKK